MHKSIHMSSITHWSSGVPKFQASEDRLPRERRLPTTLSKLCPRAQRGQGSLGTSRTHRKTAALKGGHAFNDAGRHHIHDVDAVTSGPAGGALHASRDHQHHNWAVGEGCFSRWGHQPAWKTVSWKVLFRKKLLIKWHTTVRSILYGYVHVSISLYLWKVSACSVFLTSPLS